MTTIDRYQPSSIIPTTVDPSQDVTANADVSPDDAAAVQALDTALVQNPISGAPAPDGFGGSLTLGDAAHAQPGLDPSDMTAAQQQAFLSRLSTHLPKIEGRLSTQGLQGLAAKVAALPASPEQSSVLTQLQTAIQAQPAGGAGGGESVHATKHGHGGGGKAVTASSTDDVDNVDDADAAQQQSIEQDQQEALQEQQAEVLQEQQEQDLADQQASQQQSRVTY